MSEQIDTCSKKPRGMGQRSLDLIEAILAGLMQAAAPVIRFIKAGWGSEKFERGSPLRTSVHR
jgi:hypothetical protein